MKIVKTRSFGAGPKSVLMDSNLADVLKDLAEKRCVAPEVLFHKMVENVMEAEESESFASYLRTSWWRYKGAETSSVELARVGMLTFSLLLYLSHCAGLEQNTDQTAEMLISYYAQSAAT